MNPAIAGDELAHGEVKLLDFHIPQDSLGYNCLVGEFD